MSSKFASNRDFGMSPERVGALPLRAQVVDRLADILIAFNDIQGMVEQDRDLNDQVEPAIEKIWQKINEFSLEIERELVRDFAN
jgi:hypothetical protein